MFISELGKDFAIAGGVFGCQMTAGWKCSPLRSCYFYGSEERLCSERLMRYEVNYEHLAGSVKIKLNLQ